MTIDRHPDWTTVVRKHWHRTTGFLLAGRQPCIASRDQELAAIQTNRSLVGHELQELLRWRPPESWILGVLLCPGDEVTSVLEWVQKNRVGTDRVWFFLHKRTEHEVMRPWTDAGHPLDRVDVITNWKELHKLYGLALNDQVYADWKHLEQERAGEF